MGRKVANGVIIALNIIGVICLAYFAIPYLTYDTSVPNPDAMLPLARWEGGGMALTLGLIPLIAANVLAMIFVGKGKKKLLRALFLIPCLVCMVIVAHFWVTSLSADARKPGKATEPVVMVQVHLKDENKTEYGLIYDDGGMEILDSSFDASGTSIYVADFSNFESSIDRQKNMVVNRVVGTSVTDADGNKADASDSVKAIIYAVASDINHDIIEAKIFKTGGKYFVAVQTNVNWVSPCDFYRFDEESGRLVSLYSRDNADVQQVSAYEE